MFNKKSKIEIYKNFEDIYLELEDVIEASSKSKWWKGLNVFSYEEIKNLKSLIKNIDKFYSQKTVSTVKICPAVNTLLKNSIVVKTPVDLIIKTKVDSSGVTYWYHQADGRIEDFITSHPQEQFTHNKENGNLFSDYINLKIRLPVSIKSDNAHLIMLDAYYHNDNPFKVMPGVIKFSREKFNQTELNVNTLLKALPGENEYFIKADTALCYLYFPDGYELDNKITNNFKPYAERLTKKILDKKF